MHAYLSRDDKAGWCDLQFGLHLLLLPAQGRPAGSPSKFRITDEILETHIQQYIEGQDRKEVVFSWQGGEPTLLGLEFFRKVVELEQKYKKPGQRIENDLQTNGTLLNDEWGFSSRNMVSWWA